MASALAMALASMLVASGCAWRGNDVEHYLGPVAFRYRPAESGRGSVSQVVRLGLALEAGAQWGIAAGLTDRLAGAPVAESDASDASTARFTTPFSLFPPPAPFRWNVSLLYLRVAAPPAVLVVRRLLGVELALGDEVNAASIGFTSRARVVPPPDAVSLVRYHSGRPLDSVVATFPPGSLAAHAAWMSVKEDAP